LECDYSLFFFKSK